MARIKLIVTGDMEELALHKSLQRFFPSTRDNENVIWDTHRRLNCATSHKLRQDALPSSIMRNLAQAMLKEAITGKTGKNEKPADLVIVIDDVELGNLGQEHIIAKHFKSAVEQTLKEYSGDTESRYREILRNKCSFHVLKPMVESYFFGDSNALSLAGVPVGEIPKLVHPTDVEQFETNDPAWLSTCRVENDTKRQKIPWWCHERHPKHYLEHLTARGQVFYDETSYGKTALEALAWPQVPKCQSDTSFIRSLFEDISDWFGFDIPNPLGRGETNKYFYPLPSVIRANLLLRNM